MSNGGAVASKAKVVLMNARSLSLMTIVSTIAVGMISPSAKAQSVADFYRGKTIIYNLAVPDGASWGLYARTFIEHLRKHVPAHHIINVQDTSGGCGGASANY